MTSLGETNRHNLATEKLEQQKIDVNWQTLAENVRHNIAEEGLKYDTLRETVRNNQVMNKYYLGSLDETSNHNRAVELRDLEELAEAIRHNLAVEKETWRNHTATEAEISQHNKAEEWLKQLDIAIEAWKANGGKSSSSISGGGGKVGNILSGVVSNPYLELLKGLAPGLLNSATGGLAYAISSQQKFNIRDKFPQTQELVEPSYQRVQLDVRSRGRKEPNDIPVDFSNSKGPEETHSGLTKNYSNYGVLDISNTSPQGSNNTQNSYSSSGVSNYSTQGSKGSRSNVIISPGAQKSNHGPGVPIANPSEIGQTDNSINVSTPQEAQGQGGNASKTGGGGYSGGGQSGGTR